MVKSLLKARALLLVASALVGTASAASAVSPSLLLVAALSAGAASAAAPAAGAFAVTWLTPTAEPGKTEDGRASYAGSMPMGNGALTAAAWANTSIGGLSIYVGHQNAMSSATELFKLARIEVSLSPNPFSAGAFFNQTLDIESGTFHLWLGGSSAATALAHLRVWVDANADSLYVDVSTPAGSPVSLTARVLSVRPSAPWTYTPPFFCSSVNSTPDVLVDPLPPARAYAAAPPQSAADAVRHATGARRPARTLQPPPAAVAFQPGSVVIYHRNVDSDGLTVPTVLEQQGLLGLLGVTPDHWRDLQFGLALDAGAGPALARTSPSSLASTAPGTAFTLRATALAVQTDSVDEWLADLAALVTTAAPDPRPAHDAWWAAFTARSYVAVNASAWGGLSDGFTLSQMYAVTRYTQAVQSRGTIWPIKFNGMAYIAAMEPYADDRDWGPSNWWQNTRLPYGAMLTAGDSDSMKVILDYYTNMAAFLSQRTLAYWGHPGVWTTETQHLTGAYSEEDYGCSRDPNYPVMYETSGYLHVDQGGDSGTGEWSLMALDFYSYTGDSTYLPLAFAAADYFMHHFTNTTGDGRVLVWPAQVLETYWCDYDVAAGTWTNCCENDSPTISGMMTLFEKLQALPAQLTTPAQRAAWADFAARRMPALPTSGGASAVILPAAVVSSGSHNSEGPELYAAHPHRVFTAGRQAATGADISLGVRTHEGSSWAAGSNEGWNYALNSAALLGLYDQAAKMALQRAKTAPAPGYRFMGFAPHMQDYMPSADHFANLNRCVQDMLLQSGEDGWGNATIVLLPAWPCSWDVSAKLWGPGRTSVEFVYASGHLVSLVVDPPARASAVKWARCV